MCKRKYIFVVRVLKPLIETMLKATVKLYNNDIKRIKRTICTKEKS
ncbi:MAG: hypothetical protein RL662_2188 [Bacteroidota bacterium]|jgi:predicted transcriptional regulator